VTGRSPRRSGSPAADTDRAVSNVVGFVLAFSVIVAAIGFVSVFGVEVLQDVQRLEEDNNAEIALTVLADNFEAIERGRAPRRSSELDISDGNLYVRNETEFTVEIDRSGTNPEFDVRPGSIEFRAGPESPERILYENGATLRGNVRADGAAAVGAEPRLVCRDDAAILSFVRLEESVNVGLSGGTARVIGIHEGERVLYPRNVTGANSSVDATGVTLTISSVFDRGWVDYLAREQGWDRRGTREVACDVGPDGRVFVTETVIRVRVSR